MTSNEMLRLSSSFCKLQELSRSLSSFPHLASNQTSYVKAHPLRTSPSIQRKVDLRRLFSGKTQDALLHPTSPRRMNSFHSSAAAPLNQGRMGSHPREHQRHFDQNKSSGLNRTNENASSSHNDERVRSISSAEQASEVSSATTIQALLDVLDQSVASTDFHLTLRRLCQLSAMSKDDARQTKAKSDHNRQQMESHLLSFLGKINDQQLITAIQWISQFHLEDSEFTDKFTELIGRRLRRLSPQQIVRLLEELKPSLHRARWIDYIYQRLLTLAENRYFEFDNVRDILLLSYTLSSDDRLINRFDERLLEISDHLTLDDWFTILMNKSKFKRRDRTMIRAACYHLMKLTEGSLFPLDKIKDCLSACARLNLHDRAFLERLIRCVYEQVHRIKDPLILPSIIVSMGALRLRHCELLDAIGKMLLNDSTCLSTVRTKCVQSLIRTCAAVQYSPLTLPTLIEQHVQFDQCTSSREENQPIETKNRIDLVWALTILDQANEDHLATILNLETFLLTQNEISAFKIASALKLLALYSYSLQRSTRKFPKPTFHLKQLVERLTLKRSDAQEQLATTVRAFAAENTFSRFNVVTSNLIVIDCLLVVDKSGTPQDLNTILKKDDDNSGKLNKVRLEENCFKIALKCLDYQDKTLLTNSISGPIVFQLKLLKSLGYKCVLIDHDEFIKIQGANDRVKYLQRLIKEAIVNS